MHGCRRVLLLILSSVEFATAAGCRAAGDGCSCNCLDWSACLPACLFAHRTCSPVQLPHVLALNVAEAHHGKTKIGDQDAGDVADAALEDQLAVALR